MFGSFLPELWLVGTIKVYSGHGSRHCYGIISLIEPQKGEETAQSCEMA
jgi:hypothetical protein